MLSRDPYFRTKHQGLDESGYQFNLKEANEEEWEELKVAVLQQLEFKSQFAQEC